MWVYEAVELVRYQKRDFSLVAKERDGCPWSHRGEDVPVERDAKVICLGGEDDSLYMNCRGHVV